MTTRAFFVKLSGDLGQPLSVHNYYITTIVQQGRKYPSLPGRGCISTGIRACRSDYGSDMLKTKLPKKHSRFFLFFGGIPGAPGWPLPISGGCVVPVTLGVVLLRSGGAGVAATDALLALSTVTSAGTVSTAGGWSAVGRVLFVNVVLACAAVVIMALNNSR